MGFWGANLLCRKSLRAGLGAMTLAMWLALSPGQNVFAQPAAQAIDNDGPTIMDARASFEIFATCEAALESCRSGQPIDVALKR